MTFENWFQQEKPGIPSKSVSAILLLAAEGATVPFIARYRKEQTGNLDEVAIQETLDAKTKWDEILKRQKFIIDQIQKQNKLTDELEKKVLASFQMSQLEDIYLPYKKKKKTKALKAKEAGLEPLAEFLWASGQTGKSEQPETEAKKYLNPDAGIKTPEDALNGAGDIVIEKLNENQELRSFVRQQVFEKGFLHTKRGDKAKNNSKYDKYFGTHETIKSLQKPKNSHRYMAIRRGWIEGELSLSIGGQPEDENWTPNLVSRFFDTACPQKSSPAKALLEKAANTAYKVYVQPSIDKEVHSSLKEIADQAAILVFSENVRKVLLASPLGTKAILGIDPGVRTGCKVAAVTATGQFVGETVFYLQTDEQKKKTLTLLKAILDSKKIEAIAIGNGTAGRETEVTIRSMLKELDKSIPVIMVNESGASIYSASQAAREEFPDLDLTVRGAISIARRLQDPLAELVKIDPKSIGVGQYQHDVGPSSLKKSLAQVVDSCVNKVGVELNTASHHLLGHVSGIGPSLAKGIVSFRDKNGPFKTRQDLHNVERFSDKNFQLAAGFLRIKDGENPLDNTGVHPERYDALTEIAQEMKKSAADFIGSGVKSLVDFNGAKEKFGEFTFKDLVQELERPGRDPREPFSLFQYREDIHEIKDVQAGMICPGLVTNVTNFGAFVDIGVHQDGLVHISQMAHKFVSDPREVVSPGDHVKVKVTEVNLEKGQIALSMKLEDAPKAPAKSKQPPRKAPKKKPLKSPPPKPKNQFQNTPFANLKGLKIK